MKVWVVTNLYTYPEATVVAVFSEGYEWMARRFADKRNTDNAPGFRVRLHEVDQWMVPIPIKGAGIGDDEGYV